MTKRDSSWWKQLLGMQPAVGVAASPDREIAEKRISGLSEANLSKPLALRGPGLPERFRLTDELQRAYQIMNDGPQVVFLTGKAGTGKSTLLSLFRLNTTKQVAVVAPTGVSALNVNGQTIHSFFRFPPRPLTSSDITKTRDSRLYKALDILVIDEVSMVRADLLDAIDRFLRVNREVYSKPFGGVRVIMVGDPYQLPPIVASEEEKEFLADVYSTPYFFSAKAFSSVELEVIELKENFRQEEVAFMRILDDLRSLDTASRSVEALNRHCLLEEGASAPRGSIVLTSTNRVADRINQAQLEAIGFETFRYEAETSGDFASASNSRLPAPSVLELKKGAQVMFLTNSPSGDFVNGTMGVITRLSKTHIEAEVRHSKGVNTLVVEKATWESYKYRYSTARKGVEAEVVGTYTQFPLSLAWAVTIHKSQGKTFDKVTLDLSDRAFAHGQVYVALSRCKTLGGLSLRVPLRLTDVRIDAAVQSFY